MSVTRGIISLLIFVGAMTSISAWLFTRKTVFIEGIDYYPPRPKYVESEFHMGFCGVTSSGDIYNPNYHFEPNEPDGEKLFKANCASCHHPTKIVVGPALQGVLKRWQDAGIQDTIYRWIQDPKGVYDLKIPYVKNLVDNYTTKGVSMMTPHPLDKKEIDAVLKYVEAGYVAVRSGRGSD